MRYSSVAGLAAVLGGLELAAAQTTVPVYGQCGGTGYTGVLALTSNIEFH